MEEDIIRSWLILFLSLSNLFSNVSSETIPSITNTQFINSSINTNALEQFSQGFGILQNGSISYFHQKINSFLAEFKTKNESLGDKDFRLLLGALQKMLKQVAKLLPVQASLKTFLSPPTIADIEIIQRQDLNSDDISKAVQSLESLASINMFWFKIDTALKYYEKYRLNCRNFVNMEEYGWAELLFAKSETNFNSHLGPWIPNLDAPLLKCLDSQSYDTGLVPIPPGSQDKELVVFFDFVLETMISLSKQGELSLVSFIFVNWTDYRRTWRGSKDLNLPLSIRLAPHSIWHPTFRVAKCHGMNCYIDPDSHTPVSLQYEGFAYYKTTKKLEVLCELDLSDFPFDIQKCPIKFYSFDQITITGAPRKLGFGDFTTDDWFILDISGSTANYTLEGFFDKSKPLNYPAYEIVITFKRDAKYFVQNLVIPVMLVSVVGVLTIILPTGSSDKLNMAVTVLLGFLFLQSIIADLLPNSASDTGMPKIATYLLLALLLSAYNLSISTFIIGIHNIKKPQKPYIWVEILFLKFLGPILLLNCKKNFSKLFQWIALKVAKSGPTVKLPVESTLVENPYDKINKILAAAQKKNAQNEIASLNEIKIYENSDVEDNMHKEKVKPIEVEITNLNQDNPDEKSKETQVENIVATEVENYVKKNSKSKNTLEPGEQIEWLETCEEETSWEAVAVVMNRLACVTYLIAQILIFIEYLMPIVDFIVNPGHIHQKD